jgi:hypothetical protein
LESWLNEVLENKARQYTLLTKIKATVLGRALQAKISLLEVTE